MSIGNHQQSQIDFQANPDALLIISDSHYFLNECGISFNFNNL